MKKAPSRILSVGVAATFATALFMTSGARPQVQAHSTQASLPTLRMTYWASKNHLARRFDPALINATNEADTIELVYQNMVQIGTDDKVHLVLAKSYTVSKNHKVYTFTLRPGVRFSNGDKMTAADVVFSIKRALDPKTASDVAPTYLGIIQGATEFNAGKATTLSGVKAIGSNKVQISLTKPYAYFLKTLTYTTADVLDPKVVSGKTASAQNNYLTNNCDGNVGTGQFKLKCYGSSFFPSGQTPSYTFVPNPLYWGKKAHIQIVMHAYDTGDTVYKAYLANSEDVTGIPTADLAKWKKSPQYHKQPTSAIFYLTPNVKSAPFSDKNCRLAVSYGIDRNTIDNKVLHGANTPAYTVVPKGFLGYFNNKQLHYNLKTAKSFFNKCALKSTPVQLKYATGSADADNEFAAIASMLGKVGFSIKLDALDENDWLNVVTNPLDKTNTQIVANGWQQDYPDPQDYVENLLSCDVQGPGPTSYDISGWCNSTFTKLDKQADVELNSKKRAALYVQLQKIALNDGIWIPQDVTNDFFLWKPYVHGLATTVAQVDVTAKNDDWSNVTIKK